MWYRAPWLLQVSGRVATGASLRPPSPRRPAAIRPPLAENGQSATPTPARPHRLAGLPARKGAGEVRGVIVMPAQRVSTPFGQAKKEERSREYPGLGLRPIPGMTALRNQRRLASRERPRSARAARYLAQSSSFFSPIS